MVQLRTQNKWHIVTWGKMLKVWNLRANVQLLKLKAIGERETEKPNPHHLQPQLKAVSHIMAAPLSPLSLSLIVKLKPHYLFTAHNKPFSPLRSPSLSLPPHSQRWHNLNPPVAFTPRTTKRWEVSAANYDLLLAEAEASPVETSQAIVSTSDDGVSTVISVLLFIAFVGLSILTIGVIYIAVTDFLQKREAEKFKKEEAEKKKKGGKKGKVRARARDGPRGFGQKIQEEDDYDDLD